MMTVSLLVTVSICCNLAYQHLISQVPPHCFLIAIGIGIGFQRTDYTVSEDAGVVELIIERQFGTPTEPLVLVVGTRNGTALGKHTSRLQ